MKRLAIAAAVLVGGLVGVGAVMAASAPRPHPIAASVSQPLSVAPETTNTEPAEADEIDEANEPPEAAEPAKAPEPPEADEVDDDADGD
jgi:hypothetical protein